MVVSVHVAGWTNGTSMRRRFKRAYQPTSDNTVQVDHRTRGLLVDGRPWAGWGWYMYSYASFGPHCDVHLLNRTAPGYLQRARECVVWGIGNETQAMGAMAARGINMMMPYSFSPFQRHGIPSTAATRAASVAENEKLVLGYFDEAAKHGLKILFDMAGMQIDRGEKAWNNETLLWIRESVALVKDHPALLAYCACTHDTQTAICRSRSIALPLLHFRTHFCLLNC